MAYTARVRLSSGLGKLLRSEMEEAIYEANLGTFDSLIATRVFIEKVPLPDIAAELNVNRCTLSRKLPLIANRVEEAAEMLKRAEMQQNATT